VRALGHGFFHRHKNFQVIFLLFFFFFFFFFFFCFFCFSSLPNSNMDFASMAPVLAASPAQLLRWARDADDPRLRLFARSMGEFADSLDGNGAPQVRVAGAATAAGWRAWDAATASRQFLAHVRGALDRAVAADGVAETNATAFPPLSGGAAADAPGDLADGTKRTKRDPESQRRAKLVARLAALHAGLIKCRFADGLVAEVALLLRAAVWVVGDGGDDIDDDDDDDCDGDGGDGRVGDDNGDARGGGDASRSGRPHHSVDSPSAWAAVPGGGTLDDLFESRAEVARYARAVLVRLPHIVRALGADLHRIGSHATPHHLLGRRLGAMMRDALAADDAAAGGGDRLLRAGSTRKSTGNGRSASAAALSTAEARRRALAGAEDDLLDLPPTHAMYQQHVPALSSRHHHTRGELSQA
jgi:hypothetical protein